jgi:hypothetical protein
MISFANDDIVVDQQRMSDTAETGRARVTLTLVSMASLLACAFSATSAIEIGSSTHPYTYDKAGRESFGRIASHANAVAAQRAETLARIECLADACQSLTGPIVRIAAPPLPVGPSGTSHGAHTPLSPAQPSTQPPTDARAATLVTALDTDDDAMPPPLPVSCIAPTASPTDVAPLPTPPRYGKFAHYVEVTLPSGGPWFPLPSVALDPAPATHPVRATVALDPSTQGG